jgi:hypothetical protein
VELVVELIAFDAFGFIGKELSTADFADVEDAGVIADGIFFGIEGFGLVKGKPARRPAVFETFLGAGDGDAVPGLLAGDGHVAAVVDDGDEEGVGGVGHCY